MTVEGFNNAVPSAEPKAEGPRRRSYVELEDALAAEHAAREEAETDKLTGLPDRRSFERSAQRLFAPPEDASAEDVVEPPTTYFPRLAALFVDLDRFKAVNDTYGHAKGDQVLQIVAKTLQGGIRPTDLIARWGGEEIVILMPGASEAQAAERAEKFLASIKGLQHMSDTGAGFRVSASFGIAAVENDGSATLDKLVREADTALYAAKYAGRSRVVRASTPLDSLLEEPEQFEMNLGDKNAKEPKQLGFNYDSPDASKPA